MTGKRIREGIQAFGYSALAGGLLGGICVFGWQCYGWLRTGRWVGLDALTPLKFFELPWALAPRDWLGIHALLNAVPLSIALPVAGAAILAVSALLASEEIG